MNTLAKTFGLPVGFSDHTLNNYAAYAAVVLGAEVIEKHLTFSKKMYGSDAKHSLEPDEFSDLVQGIRAIETILSSKVDKNKIADKMSEMKEVFQKSIVTTIDIPEGTIITAEMIGFKKPGSGIPASQIDKVIGKQSVKSMAQNSLIKFEDLNDA